MKELKVLRAIFIAIFLYDIAIAGEGAVILTDSKDVYELGYHLSILEDPTGELTIDDVNRPKWKAKFKRSNVKVPNYGYSDSAYWLKLKVRNESIDKRWFISFNTYYQNRVEFFHKKKDVGWEREVTGDLIPFIDRKFQFRPFLFKINQSKNNTYFFRVKSIEGAGEFEIEIMSSLYFTKVETDSNLYFGLYFGLVISMVVYNFFIFLSTKNISYFFYIMYVLFFGLFFANLKGYIPAYLFKENPWFSNEGYVLSMALSAVFLCLFTISFLNIKKNNNVVTKLFKYIIGAFILGSILGLHKSTLYYSNLLINLVAPLSLILIVFCLTSKVKSGYRPAKYFLIAFTFHLLSLLIFSLLMPGIIPSTPFTRNIVVIGSAIEMILLSMGLADRYNFQQESFLRNEKELTYNLDLKKIQLEEEVSESINMYKKLQASYDKVAKKENENIALIKDIKDKNLSLEMAKAQSEQDFDHLEKLYTQINMHKVHLEDEVKKRTYELNQSNKELKKSQEDKSFFFAKLSHELRTPLNAVLGFSDILIGKIKHNEASQEKVYLESIYSSGKSLLNLVNSVHDFTKIDLNELKIVKKEVPIIKFLKEASLYYTNECMNKGINFLLELDDDLPHWIESDEQRLRQVLDNLLSNALKFTEKGYIKLTARSSFTDNQKDKVDLILGIEDTGRGMETEKMVKLFKAFGQVHEQGSINERGTGLGLYISKQIIEQLGGEVSVESKVGKGTAFKLGLKDIKVIQDEKEDKDKVDYTFFGDTVLIADDFPVNINLLEAYLSPFDLKIETAKDGRELIDKAKKINPSLIVTDFKMPIITGTNALRTLREDGIDTPIILVSALVVDDKIKKEFQGFLQKPIEKETFIKEISRFLKNDIEVSKETSISEEIPEFIIPGQLDQKDLRLLLKIKEFLLSWKETGNITSIETKSSKLKGEIKETNLSTLIPWFEELELRAHYFQLDIIDALTGKALEKIEEHSLM